MTSPASGASAPDFALRDQHGATVRLSALRGDKAVLLVFYPYAFSRVCTRELVDLREAWTGFDRPDVEVLAVSCDPMFSLRAYADAEGFPFRLLSDFWPHGAVAAAYGVFDEDRGHARRSTFVVDREGRVAWQVHNEMPDARSLEAYAAALDRVAPTGAGAPPDET